MAMWIGLMCLAAFAGGFCEGRVVWHLISFSQAELGSSEEVWHARAAGLYQRLMALCFATAGACLAWAGVAWP